MADTPTIESVLARAYGALVMGVEPVSAVQTDFSTYMQDGDFASSAQAKLAGYTDDICSRCFMSKTYRDFLARQLNSN